MSSLKTQFITHNPFSTCLEIPRSGGVKDSPFAGFGLRSRTVRGGYQRSGQQHDQGYCDTRETSFGVPAVSKCVQCAQFISFQPISFFDPHTLWFQYIFPICAQCVVFFTLYTNLPHPLRPPFCPIPAVSQPERRNVRLDGCSSGNVPFQSAFAPEISTLIPLRPIPAKTGIWWEGNVVGWGGWESRIQFIY